MWLEKLAGLHANVCADIQQYVQAAIAPPASVRGGVEWLPRCSGAPPVPPCVARRPRVENAIMLRLGTVMARVHRNHGAWGGRLSMAVLLYNSKDSAKESKFRSRSLCRTVLYCVAPDGCARVAHGALIIRFPLLHSSLFSIMALSCPPTRRPHTHTPTNVPARPTQNHTPRTRAC